jgi:DNA-binding MarR family transcriptional regulator
MNEFSECPTEGAIGLLALLINSGRLAEGRLDNALGAVDLTFVKWRALDALVKLDAPASPTLLAEKLHCVKSNVTQLVDKLEAENIVRREADPADRRGTLVQLTCNGKRLHKTGRDALDLATQTLFAAVDDASKATLRSILSRI